MLYYSYDNLIYLQNTYQILVNDIIPRTPELAYEFGAIQYYGALDEQIEEFVIDSLNRLEMPLAMPSAEMLNIVAYIPLSPYNLLYALALLNQLQINLSILPIPFQDNPQLVIRISDFLYSQTMMGYYSEWSGYGSTRLEEPNLRKLEFHPISWKQVQYPGPSLGYRALRTYSFS